MPAPPVTISAPVVVEVDAVVEYILMAPWTEMPLPAFKVPLTPKPPTILNAPVVDDVEFVLDNIDTAPTKVEVV